MFREKDLLALIVHQCHRVAITSKPKSLKKLRAFIRVLWYQHTGHSPPRIWGFVGLGFLGCLQKVCYEILFKCHTTIFDVAMVEERNWNCWIKSWCSSVELITRKILRSLTPTSRLGLVLGTRGREEMLWLPCRKLNWIYPISLAAFEKGSFCDGGDRPNQCLLSKKLLADSRA